MENTLPGIVKIQIVRCEHIQAHAMNMALCGALVAIAAPSQNVKFFGTPQLKWEGAMVNGARQEKSTLEFSTSEQLPENGRLAVVVTQASGKQYLIGAREPKYPVFNYTETAGSPSGEAALRTYKITHIAQKSVLPCVL